jgi:hypothetical protein
MRANSIKGVYDADGRMRPGCSIYLAIADFGAAGKFVKAGFSTDPWKRLGSIQTGCPMPVKTLAYVLVPGDAMARKIEGLLHKVYAPCRTSGEWFQFDLENEDHKKRWSGGLSAVLNETLGRGKWHINYLDVAAAKEANLGDRIEKAKKTRSHKRNWRNAQRENALAKRRRMLVGLD